MLPFLKTQRFAAVASVVTSLMLVSGCRSAAVDSGSSLNSSPTPVGVPPFYRSFERSTPAYNDGDPNQMVPNAPPAILPVPGYSEPGFPPEPTVVPPAPSVQKSKWNRLPSGLKFPSWNRPHNEVRQTAAKPDNLGSSANSGKTAAVATAPTPPEADDAVVEEPFARPRLSPRIRRRVTPSTGSEAMTGADRSAPKSNTGDMIAPPQTAPNLSSPTDGTPLLLPPGL